MQTDYGTDSSPSSINNAYSALVNNYSYLASNPSNHNEGSVINSLSNGRPVYMRGFNNQPFVGHAWVCDGYLCTTCNRNYLLKIISVVEPPLQYENAGNYSDALGYYYFHMNWGNHGDFNGWFLGDQVNMNAIRNYNSYRKDILNITPNN